MGETTTVATHTVETATPTPAPMVSTSYATQGTAAGAGGAAAAIVVLLCWILEMVHIPVPGEVAAAITTLVGILVHWLVIRFGFPSN